MKFILGVAILATMILLLYVSDTKKYKLTELVEGTVYIKGRVIGIKRSGNHTFGIIQIIVDSSFLDYRMLDEKARTNLPFRIQNDTAEIYTTIGANYALRGTLTFTNTTGVATVTDQNERVISEYSTSPLYDYVNRVYVCENTIIMPNDICAK